MLNIRKASAGAGKTYNLTKRYIHLLLTTTDDQGRCRLVSRDASGRHRHILAITFTNKATEEMKRRIVHELAVLAGMERDSQSVSDYLDELIEITGASASEIKDRAERALRNLLNDFGEFNVLTIDSFFQSVLRTFAREAELPGNYEVDLDEDGTMRIGVHEMLQSINRPAGKSPEETADLRRLEAWLLEMMRHRMVNGNGFDVFNTNGNTYSDVVRFMKRISNEKYAEKRDEMEKYLADPERLKAFVAVLRKEIEQARERARERAAEVIDLPDMKASVRKYFEPWASTAKISKEPQKTLLNLREKPEGAFEKKAQVTDGDPRPGLVRAAAEAIGEAWPRMTVCREMLEQVYILGLIGNVNKHVAEYRAETSTMLLADTTSILSKIIGDDNAPFIYERTGQWINHFLIDEFQDTSRMQWKNLRPLVENSLSMGYENLVIGDEKQCIYRFRNSDPSLLHNLHHEFGRSARLDGHTAADRTNWRSAADIVRFNNTFFRAAAAAAPQGSGVSEIYADVMQYVAKKNVGLPGYVRINRYSKAGGREEAFDITINEIRRQIESGYRPADIAVLVRKTATGAAFILRLMERVETDPSFPRIKVMSDEALYVGNSPAVKLVISMLRLLDSTAYRRNDRALSEREAAALFSLMEQHVCGGKERSEAIAAAIADFRETDLSDFTAEILDAECITLPAIVTRIISRFVSAERRVAESVYLSALMDLVTERTAAGQGEIHDFLDWWNRKGRTAGVPMAQDANAIRVMTIHKSKGLEFECVHLPFCDEAKPPGEMEWFYPVELDFIDAELMPPLIPLMPSESKLAGTPFEPQLRKMADEAAVDDMNVYYVAFTRARRELIVNVCSEGNGKMPFTPLVDDVLARFTPSFFDALHGGLEADPDHREYIESTPEAARVDPYIQVFASPDGTVEIGEPTAPVETKTTKLTLLDPTETVAMPDPRPRFTAPIWENLDLDPDDAPVPSSQGMTVETELLLLAMGRITVPGDIPSVVAALVEQGKLRADRAEAFKELLVQKVSGPATARWFTDCKRVITGRYVSPAQGRSVRIDRMVWPAGSDGVEIVMFDRPGEDVERTAGYLLRAMTYSRQFPKASAYVWSIADGRITQISAR